MWWTYIRIIKVIYPRSVCVCIATSDEKDMMEHLGQCPNVFGSGKCVDILCDRESEDWKWLLNVVRRNSDSI